MFSISMVRSAICCPNGPSKRRNGVERAINRLKHFRAVATRYAKRAYVLHSTVTVASIRLRLSP